MKLLRSAIVVGLLAILVLPAPGQPQPTSAASGRPVPVAETRLLMQGINMPNFHGLEDLLRKPPADTDAWVFARGQALLIAESGNLLMLRPPRRQGRDAWMQRSEELRDTATRLARDASSRNLDAARSDFKALADTCNHCHQTFRVSTRVGALEQEPPHPSERRKPIP